MSWREVSHKLFRGDAVQVCFRKLRVLDIGDEQADEPRGPEPNSFKQVHKVSNAFQARKRKDSIRISILGEMSSKQVKPEIRFNKFTFNPVSLEKLEQAGKIKFKVHASAFIWSFTS